MWSHYKFRTKVVALGQKYKTNVLEVSEAYTTMTCGACGSLKSVMGAKTYTCKSCPYVCDRDIHGARNILIRSITQNVCA